MNQGSLVSTTKSAPSFPALAYQGTPVLTSEMLAQAYDVSAKQIRQNFNNNRERFVEGKHYFSLTGKELKEFKNCVDLIDTVKIPPRTPILTLWTDRGSARHAKMLESEKAWDVYELLEDTFFSVTQPAALPDASTLTPSARAELKAIVDAKLSTYPSDIQGKARGEIWVRFNRHFKIAEYAQLPMSQMPDARDYLVELKPKALAQTKEQKALPPSPTPALKSAGRGRDRVQSKTELRLLDMLIEANNLDNMGYTLEDFFRRLGEIAGPLNLQAIEAMRRTDDKVTPDSLIQTMHYHRWYARERMRDTVNSARDACRSAIVVARLLGA